MMATPKLTNRIKELRHQHGLTQEDLARRVGVTRQTIIAIEQDKYSPSLTLAFQIAQEFQTDIESVFEFKK